jgi:signal transduction histidine kinase
LSSFDARGANVEVMVRIRDAPPTIKILLTAIVLILLPGVVLSYIGLSSVNDRARQLEAGYRGTLNLVRDRIEQEITGLEQEVFHALDQSGTDLESLGASRQLLQTISSKHPWLKLPFLASPDGAIITSTASLGWLKPRSGSSSMSAFAADLFARAEAAEFVRKDYAEAVKLYSQALQKVRSIEERALLLSCTGRCRFKMGSYPRGIQDYQQLLSLSEDAATLGEVPTFVVALSQIADGYTAVRDEKGRIATLQLLYEKLLTLPWDVSASLCTHYLKQTSRELDAYAVQHGREPAILSSSRPEELRNREEVLLQSIHRMEWIQTELLLEIRPRAMRSLAHISSKREGANVQFSYFRLGKAAQASDDWMLGYELDVDQIMKTLVPRILDTVDLGADLRVAILDDTGTFRFAQINPQAAAFLVAENFSEILPFLKVGLFHSNGGSIDQLIRREKATYLAFLSGTLLVMILGIFLTVRAAAHEVAVSRLKSEFVSNVSHEFKTPLALIRMFGETLESGMVLEEAKRREFYSIIRAESERLTHLINKVLDFSRIDAGVKQYNFREADVVDLIRNTVDTYSFQIRDLGFTVDCRLPPYPITGRIDPEAVAEAVLNLLDNATKYSGECRDIRVTVHREESQIYISVEDQGVGIPKEELPRIFEKFYRARTAATREAPGSGLGLALVKHIAEAHGGRVAVESKLGRGSRFTINIPTQA